MRSSVIISANRRQGGEDFEITVVQRNGKHLAGLAGGFRKDLGEAAARAAMYASCHCLPNPAGGDIVGPREIVELIPENLRNIPPITERKNG